MDLQKLYETIWNQKYNELKARFEDFKVAYKDINPMEMVLDYLEHYVRKEKIQLLKSADHTVDPPEYFYDGFKQAVAWDFDNKLLDNYYIRNTGANFIKLNLPILRKEFEELKNDPEKMDEYHSGARFCQDASDEEVIEFIALYNAYMTYQIELEDEYGVFYDEEEKEIMVSLVRFAWSVSSEKPGHF